ncbi:MAG: hypothetical protein ACP5NV_04885 [Candidatus Woesearchaeota archaeon]
MEYDGKKINYISKPTRFPSNNSYSIDILSVHASNDPLFLRKIAHIEIAHIENTYSPKKNVADYFEKAAKLLKSWSIDGIIINDTNFTKSDIASAKTYLSENKVFCYNETDISNFKNIEQAILFILKDIDMKKTLLVEKELSSCASSTSSSASESSTDIWH